MKNPFMLFAKLAIPLLIVNAVILGGGVWLVATIVAHVMGINQ